MRRIRQTALLALTAGLLVPAGAQAATKVLTAGPPVNKPPKGVPKDSDTNAFYSNKVTIHVGDKVRWQIAGFHTVTFPVKGKKPPAFISQDATNKISNSNDAAGAPFWFNGLPRLVLDPQGAFPAKGRSYDGSKLVSSGAPLQQGKPKPYTLKFPKAGSFTYYCTIHPGMKGTVKVVAKGKAVPSAAADKKAVAAQFAKAVARVKGADKFAGPSGNAVQAGNDSADGTTLLRFFPAQKTVPVGTTVTFSMSPHSAETHTFSFGPAAYLKQQADGFISPDAKGPLVFNPLIGYPSDPPAAMPPYTGANHGNGFESTGVLDSVAASPNPASAKITFSKAGTYSYICLIHPDMKGTIVVTG